MRPGCNGRRASPGCFGSSAMGEARGLRRLLQRLRESSSAQGTLLVFPALGWTVVFLVLPLVLILVLSLAWRGQYGPVDWGTNLREFLGRLSFDNYARLANPLYLEVLWTSFRMAGLTTGICILVGYPVAYFLARSQGRLRGALLFLLLIPFWTYFLIRIYAWVFILRTEGLLNRALVGVGLLSEPVRFMYTPTAVIIAMVYEFLPFMVLPLFTSLEQVEASLLAE